MTRGLVGLVFAFVVLAAISSPTRAQPVDLELVLAVDVSGSIDFEEARLQRQGYMAAFLDPVVLGAIASGPHGRIAVTYIEWAGALSRTHTS